MPKNLVRILVCCALSAAMWGGCQTAERQDEGLVTFNRHVAPIVFATCAECHRPGAAGPFSLLSYEDVKKRSTQIVEVTASGYMPPWKPDPGYGEFVGARRLSEEQILTFERWVADGELEGPPIDLPEPHWNSDWQLGEPDLVVQLEETYMLPGGGIDVYRNFAIALPVATRCYVEAVEFRTHNALVTHHAVIMLDPTGKARRHDERDVEPGFGGMEFGDAQGPVGHFIGWTPSKTSYRSPDLAWPLDPGTDLVVQLHMLPSGKPEEVQVSVGLFFTDVPPARQSALLRLSSKALDIPPGEPDYAVTDSYVLPVDVEITSVYPHAHYLGKRIAAFATLPDGKVEQLIRISEWDFAWQDEYRYALPVFLPKGSILRAEFSFDNSADNPFNPRDPPVRVFYGRCSYDEMADLTLQVVPRNARDWGILRRDYQHKWLEQEVVGLETVLKAHPDGVDNHHTLAMLYQQTGRGEEALFHFAEALRLEPDYAEVHVNLGIALALRRDLAGAIDHLEQALANKPGFVEAHFNLGLVLQLVGRTEEARRHLAAVVAKRPEMAAVIKSRLARLQGAN
ncbi:MAG: tetratricopeptide repeat protein [Candidatus Latescibacterota bacterium]|nr:tetratricopeptide repeat protein [Candidatus Latescibacterota bacterium]